MTTTLNTKSETATYNGQPIPLVPSSTTDLHVLLGRNTRSVAIVVDRTDLYALERVLRGDSAMDQDAMTRLADRIAARLDMIRTDPTAL